MSDTFQVDIFRHTESDYNNYLVLESPDADPNKYVDYSSQVADINESGLALAKKRATEFLETVDPENEMVVVITSGEMRAYKTAEIFLNTLAENGVEVFDGIPSQSSQYPVGINKDLNPSFEADHNRVNIDNRIVVHSAPSLDYKATWVQDMLEPREGSVHTTFKGLNVDKLSAEDRKRYLMARRIIAYLGDDASSWGSNYKKFEGKSYPFDVIPTAQENHTKMMKALKLLRRLHKSEKTQEYEGEKKKKIRYVVFTHEENVLQTVRSYFDTGKVGNLEQITLDVPLDPTQLVMAKFRGEVKQVADLLLG